MREKQHEEKSTHIVSRPSYFVNDEILRKTVSMDLFKEVKMPPDVPETRKNIRRKEY